MQPGKGAGTECGCGWLHALTRMTGLSWLFSPQSVWSRRRWFSAVLLFGFVLAGITVWFGGEDTASMVPYRVTLLERGFAIEQRGVLESVDAVPAIVPVKGYISELVDEGTPVKTGDPIFLMDPSTTLERIEEKEISYHRDKVKLKSARERLAFTEQKERASYELAEAEWQHAQLELEHALSMPDAEELRRLEIDRQLAVLDLEDAQSALERNQRLFDKDFISALALEPYTRAVETAKVYLQEIELEIQIRNKGIPEERRVQLERNAQAAKAKLQRFEERMNRLLNVIRIEIEMTEKRLLQIEHEIAFHKQRLQEVQVRAQSDGVVRILKYYDWRLGGRLVPFRQGMERWPQDMIAEVIDPANMKIDVVIHESDVHSVKAGRPVTIRVLAYPDRTFKGTLKSVGSIGRDRNRIDPVGQASGLSGVMVYNAEVTFDNQGLEFRPGMSALVAIEIKPVEQRLLIPRAALQGTAAAPFVYVKNRLGYERLDVQGEVFDELYFEVSSGIEVEDVIALNPQVISGQ